MVQCFCCLVEKGVSRKGIAGKQIVQCFIVADKAINQSKIAITPHNIVNPANPPLKNVGVLKSEASSSHQSNKCNMHRLLIV